MNFFLFFVLREIDLKFFQWFELRNDLTEFNQTRIHNVIPLQSNIKNPKVLEMTQSFCYLVSTWESNKVFWILFILWVTKVKTLEIKPQANEFMYTLHHFLNILTDFWLKEVVPEDKKGQQLLETFLLIRFAFSQEKYSKASKKQNYESYLKHKSS